jgi:hypothetical protein
MDYSLFLSSNIKDNYSNIRNQIRYRNTFILTWITPEVLSARYDFLSIRVRSFSTLYGGRKANDIQRHHISFMCRNYRVTVWPLPFNL